MSSVIFLFVGQCYFSMPIKQAHNYINLINDCSTTGHVVTMECVEKIIKKDWLHPLTGDKLKEKYIIPLQRGGTGYSLTNQNLEGKNERPVLQA